MTNLIKTQHQKNPNPSRTVRFEGHGLLPFRLVLSLLSHRPVRIDNIRSDSQEPGLNDEEVSFLRLLEKLTNGTTVEISYTGTSLLFVPGTLTGGHITHQTPLSSSIGYFLTPILAIAPFCKHDLTLILKGITTSSDTLSVDLLRVSGLPTLGIWLGEDAGKLELKISKRGHAPLGGGECCFKCPSVKAIKAGIDFTDSGRVSKIRGIAHSVRVSPQLANRLVSESRAILNRYIPDVFIYTDVYKGADSGKSPGYALSLLSSSTTTALHTAEASSYPNSTPEDVAVLACRRLLNQISRGGCIDQNFEWLAVLMLLLSNQTDVGKIKIGGPISEALVLWIRDLKQVFGVQYKIKAIRPMTMLQLDQDDPTTLDDGEVLNHDQYLISAVGLGWINTAKSAK
ncbi:RNA 3'-terminal phosphate cyclase/enolpyruvate transferase [Phakopsora pachyrhizi]|uniref:RNA 3'-terminal phosphate cyclase/enolpyruvate transferase n=1 Tax=Phakopsora pachyrhizi TaxID=170000 RepID=A0AAV0BLW2_PHAPC|nr:RNA 3'-terminal phosphate cyclase/enolpyruvate transferase [Phakopsora pachyrhizi]CAH7688237.1 RNA 3'-terminal phosphate cyclase/enolpyruvate transferase [Phakopsora pachyrhizi]